MNPIPEPIHLVTQVLIYLALIGILYFTLFKPVLAILAARHKKTHGNLAAAEQKLAEFQRIDKEYRQSLERVRKELFEEKLRKISEASGEAGRLYAAARDASKARLERARSEIEKDSKALESALSSTQKELIEEVYQKVLQS